MARQFLKAEPLWTTWKGQSKRQSLRGHFGKAKAKGRAFMDTLESPILKGRAIVAILEGVAIRGRAIVDILTNPVLRGRAVMDTLESPALRGRMCLGDSLGGLEDIATSI